MKLRLKQARALKGESLRKAAESLGMSFQDLSRLENGQTIKTKIGSAELSKFAKYYGVSIDFLIDSDKHPKIDLEIIHISRNSKF